MNLTHIYLRRFFPVELSCQEILMKKRFLIFKKAKYVIIMNERMYSLHFFLAFSKLDEPLVRNIVYRNNGEIFSKDDILVFNTEEECNAAIEELREAMFLMTYVKEMLS